VSSVRWCWLAGCAQATDQVFYYLRLKRRTAVFRFARSGGSLPNRYLVSTGVLETSEITGMLCVQEDDFYGMRISSMMAVMSGVLGMAVVSFAVMHMDLLEVGGCVASLHVPFSEAEGITFHECAKLGALYDPPKFLPYEIIDLFRRYCRTCRGLCFPVLGCQNRQKRHLFPC